VAHEINNLITGIIGYAEILKDQCHRQGEDDEIPGRIIKDGGRIATIVNSLLSFASGQEKKVAPVYINKIVADSLNLAHTQMKKERIRLKLDFPAKLPKIRAQSQQIQQVFLNIINNSRYSLNQKFHGYHKEKILEISGETIEIDGHKQVRTTFHDHGNGIPSGIVNKICEPFFSTKPKGEGTGLGLSVSHGIVKDHGGRILFDSIEGEHARVMVDLPADERKNEGKDSDYRR
jgi:signal transduction histidine kinase